MKQEEIEKQSDYYVNRLYKQPNSSMIIDELEEVMIKQAFQDGTKWGMEHAIEWHDLRKNPDDLPKEKTMYRVIYDNPMINQPAMWYLPNLKAWEYSGLPIIAWCELPTYKE